MPSNSLPPKKRSAAVGGTLYIVATPIGNLNDITLRAIEILRTVDIIAAEDTRQTGILLKAHGIDTRLMSYHEHNERQRAAQLIEKLQTGSTVAVVSDAGTPTVSDPGYRLVSAAVDAGIDVVPLPGVSAATAALSVSGLPTDSFTFIGFPEKKAGKRTKQLQKLADCRETLIFYESPRRISALLEDVCTWLGDRPAVLAREMTKRHEEFIRGSVSQVIAVLGTRSSVKGECTLLVAGKLEHGSVDKAAIRAEIASQLAAGETGTGAVSKMVARKFNISKNEAYALVLAIKENR
jgi:16S rRNA (cytidine1402-2'-O)-methyltransferase